MFQIFTDLAANIPQELVDRWGLGIIPIRCTVDGEVLDVSKGFDGPAFYAAMRAGAKTSTSMPAPAVFLDAFRPVLERGEDILYIGMSSGISGTVGLARTVSAELGEEFPERRRGGRLHSAVAVVGNMLNVKPVLFGDQDGHIVLRHMVVGRRRSLDTLAAKYKESCVDMSGPVGLAHCDSPKDAALVAEKLRAAGCTGEILTVCYEPVTGSHVGPGTVALFFYGPRR